MATGVRTSKTDFPADVKKLVKEMFTPGYKFPKQDTDDDMKVNVSEYVAFGDIENASRVEPQNEEVGGTITAYICTVRKFFPGHYKVSVIHLYDDNDPLVIFHHETVDPNLLAKQVICLSEDYCDYHRGLLNSINRYDWCYWTNYGGDSESDEDSESDKDSEYEEDSEDDKQQVNPQPKKHYTKANNVVMSLLEKKFEGNVVSTVPLRNEGNARKKSFIYFTKVEKAKELSSLILKNQIRRSSSIKYLFSVQDDDGETVSLGVYFLPFNQGDWEYGKAFEDSATGSYFALVVNGYLDLYFKPWMEMYDEKTRKNLGFSTVKNSRLRFPMTKFKFNDN